MERDGVVAALVLLVVVLVVSVLLTGCSRGARSTGWSARVLADLALLRSRRSW